MRLKMKEVVKKCHQILLDDNYVSAEMLSRKLNVAPSAVFRAIRMLRQEGIGVHTTPNGYVLSEYAKKSDDVHFLRRLHGRRTSDFFAMHAAEPHIQQRWKGLEDRRGYALISAPLRVTMKSLTTGNKTLLDYSKKISVVSGSSKKKSL